MHEQEVRDLIDGCRSPGTSWEDWCAYRQFIATEIDCDGSILDVGCANGFLLLCLAEWTGRKLKPYGVDVDRAAVAAAKALMPQHADNFAAFDIANVSTLNSVGLPENYEFVIWNLWWAWPVASSRSLQVARMLQGKVKAGKLLITLYAASRDQIGTSDQLVERRGVVERVMELRSALGEGTVVLNPSGGSQALVALPGRRP